MVQIHGKGDPEYLENVYMSLHTVAKDNDCEVVNFSTDIDSRLPYEKARPHDF